MAQSIINLKTGRSVYILYRLSRFKTIYMNNFHNLLILFLFCGTLCPSLGYSNSTMQTEINHLLNYVGNSDCIFIRNGNEYDAKNALKHIQKKYKYFKSDINSAEKFIELSATKSTRSNKLYFIRCGNAVPISSQRWLLEELSRIRSENSTGEP